VAVVPGDAFGADDYIRLSYATSMENLEKALTRIAQSLGRLKPTKQAKRVALSNVQTRVRGTVPTDARLPVQLRDGLTAEAETRLAGDVSFTWNANIAGVIVRLKTNVRHIHDMWVENWTPAPSDAEIEPHGIIYAVDGIAGREPRAFYNTETKTGVVVNVDSYGPIRSLALGLAGDVAERHFGAHLLRAMSVDLDGRGLLLIGPPGTKKTDLFFGLLRDPKFRFLASDMVLVRTNSVELFGRLAPLFDRSKCENVVVRKEECPNAECLRTEDCRLDRGSPFCYKASKDAQALLDPDWLGGPAAVVRRTALRWIFVLRNDSTSPAVETPRPEDALRVFERGECPGVKKATTAVPHPFFNPYLLVSSDERLELEKSFFRRLLPNVETILLNSGSAGVEKIKEIVGA
jgi:hypothetical protein